MKQVLGRAVERLDGDGEYYLQDMMFVVTCL
jgi:hypothetical protein